MKKTILKILVGLCIAVSIFANSVVQDMIKHKQNLERTKKTCIKLQKINLKENEIISLEIKELLLQEYSEKCIDIKLLKNIVNKINQFFMDSGYVTTKAYLKEQDIKDGGIDIDIVKGIVEDIVSDDISTTSLQLATAFIGQEEKLLNLRELETSLEMINRVPSIDAKFKIEPGTSYGKSIVNVDIKEQIPVHLTLGVSGEKFLNDNNPDLTAVLSVDNPLNLNDILSFTYNGSRIQKKYQSTKGKELNYSFPIGSYLYELIYSNTTYRQGVQGLDATYLANGKTISKQFKVNKVLLRDQFNKFTAAVLLDHKNTKNYFENELIEVSSYKTTQAEIDLTHTYLQNWGSVITTYTYHKGLEWFDARADGYTNIEGNVATREKLQFQKHTLESDLSYYFDKRKYQIDSTVHLQYSNDLLYNNDQISVGSSYSVRGYSSVNLVGNTGGYIKNDFYKHIELNYDEKFLKQLSFFAGADYGKVKCESNNQQSCGDIYSASLGLKTSANKFSTDFTWSKPLKKLSDNFSNKSLFNFNITMKF